MLKLDEACNLVGLHRAEQLTHPPPAVTISRRVMQFWDRHPPTQIQTLLDRTRDLCSSASVEYVFFDEPRARAHLVEHLAPSIVEAFDLAVHPAMKCDVFRLAWLYSVGGHYVDADIVLRPNLGQLFELPGTCLVYQWDSRGLSNLCNWLIGGHAGDPSLRRAMEVTADNVSRQCRQDPQAALKNILGVSGPGIFTRAVASDLQRRRSADSQDASSVRIETVSRAHQLIELGPTYLKAALGYKSDARHWRTAGSVDDKTSELAASTLQAPLAAAPPLPSSAPTSDPWHRRLTNWLTKG
ncbi:glycosyltransferase [Ideonella oryzae]|uniref:Uncharacterized protein n=1 Tax=Ideonella oryzae TaxID=2937441 RepID=A0ABT1BQW3_9BURK|nr:glycosyltransferase [Ideonella oryzae]MCO5978609.1 hypothetical protein [Ideonella oryzae]